MPAPNPLNDPDVQHLSTVASAIADLDAARARLVPMRNALLRKLDAEERYGRTFLASVAGISRPVVWGILNPATVEDESGQVVDVDHAALELLDALLEEALERWESAGRVGSPDDYFPVDARRAH
jgi:hypothetical protein